MASKIMAIGHKMWGIQKYQMKKNNLQFMRDQPSSSQINYIFHEEDFCKEKEILYMPIFAIMIRSRYITSFLPTSINSNNSLEDFLLFEFK